MTTTPQDTTPAATLAAKIKKLLEKARSAQAIGSAAEAAAFSAKVEELLVRHELTMTDVEYATLANEDPIGTTRFDPKAHDLDYANQRRPWEEDLATALARAYFCRIIVLPGTNIITFVGRASHREALEYVYGRLLRECQAVGIEERKRAMREARAAGRRLLGFWADFRRGFNVAVSERLRREEVRRRREAEAAHPGGTALVRLDDARQAVTRYMRETLKTRSAGGLSGYGRSGTGAWEAGHRAGQRANLTANGVQGGRNGAPRSLGSGQGGGR